MKEIVNLGISKAKYLKKPSKYFYTGKIEKIGTRPEKAENKWKLVLDDNSNDIEWY